MTEMTAEMFGANTPIVPDETLDEWLKDEPVKKMTKRELIQKQIEELQTALKLLEIEENRRPPCEKAYRDAYGEFPITDSMSGGDGDYIAWDAFQKGWESSRVYHNKYFVIANSKEEEVKKLQEKDWNIKVETDYLTGKAQQEPQMTLKKSGDCDVISYDHKYYYRLSFGVGDYFWYKRYIGSSNLMRVEDPEEHRLLEEYYDGVILDTGGVVETEKRKIDDLAERLLPDDHPYKITDEHGESNPYKQYLNLKKPTNLTDLIYDWWEDIFTSHSDLDMETSIDDLVERIKRWFPKPIEETCGLSENDADWNRGYNTYREYLMMQLK